MLIWFISELYMRVKGYRVYLIRACLRSRRRRSRSSSPPLIDEFMPASLQHTPHVTRERFVRAHARRRKASRNEINQINNAHTQIKLKWNRTENPTPSNFWSKNKIRTNKVNQRNHCANTCRENDQLLKLPFITVKKLYICLKLKAKEIYIYI